MSNPRLKCSNEDRQEMLAFVHFVLFQEWEGMKEAIRNGMGGRTLDILNKKKNTLAETISNLCCSQSADEDEVELMLEDLVDELFNTWFEDDSVGEIAAVLWNHSRKLLAGDRESLRSYVAARERLIAPAPAVPVVESDDEMETDTDAVASCSSVNLGMDNSSTVRVSNVDADGWEVPKRSRRRNR